LIATLALLYFAIPVVKVLSFLFRLVPPLLSLFSCDF